MFPIKPKRSESSSEKDVRIVFRCSLTNTIRDVMRERPGWFETDSDVDWDVNWADVAWIRDFYDRTHLEPHQRLNHFRNHTELTRKDYMIKNLKKTKKQLEKSGQLEEAAKYDFWPLAFAVPQEYGMFLEEFKKYRGIWIMKPVGKSQGRGIFLITKVSDIQNWKKDTRWQPGGTAVEPYIVQRYVENPYLVGGKKFDLRIYVLVTSYSPLVDLLDSPKPSIRNPKMESTIFVRYFAPLCDGYHASIVDMHLTNVAIQKTAKDYHKDQGCKWDLRALKTYMKSKHGEEAVDELFMNMQSLIIRSILAVQPIMITDKHCFELYGYDILIDSALKPWLLEVNASPSLTADTKDDYTLKYQMLNDMFDVVDPEGRRSGDEVQVGGFDMIWNDGPFHIPGVPEEVTTLGCVNDVLIEKEEALKLSKLAPPPG